MKHRTRVFFRFLIFGGMLTGFGIAPAIAATSFGLPGFYVGAQVGYGKVAYEDVNMSLGAQPSMVDDAGLAPVFELGYDVSDDIAVELDVIYFHKPKFHNIGLTGDQTGKIKNNLIYLAGRFGIPFKQHFFAYTKIGLGYVVRDDILSFGQTVLQGGEFIRPVYGLGVVYSLDQHWSLEASWVQSPEDLGVEIPTSNFFGMGAAYKF